MKKKYIVVTPVKVPGAKKGAENATIAPGKPIELDDDEAEPLIACGAIRKPDVIEDDSATAAS
jgi:hypothetical protein